MTSRSGAALGEAAAAVQVPRLLGALPSLLRRRPRHAEVVLVLPGRGVDDLSTGPLRWVLARRGHDVRGWGLGVDDGDVERLLPLVVELILARAAEAGHPVAVVGQSLGGYLAREAARLGPDAVRTLVTLGTPIFRRRSPGPLTVPVTAIWSRADRIVPPFRAVDRDPGTTMVEVRSPHLGMGLDPDAIRAVIRSVER